MIGALLYMPRARSPSVLLASFRLYHARLSVAVHSRKRVARDALRHHGLRILHRFGLGAQRPGRDVGAVAPRSSLRLRTAAAVGNCILVSLSGQWSHLRARRPWLQFFSTIKPEKNTCSRRSLISTALYVVLGGQASGPPSLHLELEPCARGDR